MIRPEPGRHVHYWPAPGELIDARGGQPLAAIVVDVLDDRKVSLSVFDIYGYTHSKLNITLVQDGDVVPASAHCTWMPYQLYQASKNDGRPVPRHGSGP